MTKAKLDKGRVSLETNTIERFGQPSADGKVPVWLFLVDIGHFIVFSQRDISSRVDLDALTRAEALRVETREERVRLGALRLRLISTDIDPKKRRLKIPSDAFDICGEYLDRAHIWLEQSSARLEFYTATYAQTALAVSPSRLLPESSEEEGEQ